MANKLITEMGLPISISNIFTARNITTAKDALSLTEFELMELLDVGLFHVRSALSHISQVVCPPCQNRVRNEQLGGHLPTRLKGLDDALCGGVPFGVLTELVGPAGLAKHKMIEIGLTSFPDVFHKKGMAQEMAGRILVLRPASLAEFTESLQEIKISILQHKVKLLVIDSMAALGSGENEQGFVGTNTLGWHISFLKSLAEFSRIPIVVTNQVRSQSRDGAGHYSFQGKIKEETLENSSNYDSHLIAALGINWAHAVTIRLVLESKIGQRFMKVAKSPISPPLAFPFTVASSGITLLDDDGFQLTGPQINTIDYQGHSDIINPEGERSYC